jgi:hypothetical protein
MKSIQVTSSFRICVTALFANLALVLAAHTIQAGPVLLVGSSGTTGAVGEYDGVTGTALNSNFIPLNNLGIWGLAFDGNNNHLFVGLNSSVGEYNATTGATINANLITSNLGQRGLATDSKNHLFVADLSFTPGVTQYDLTTGTAIPNFTAPSGPCFGIATDGNNRLYVDYEQSNNIAVFDATSGTTINSTFATLSGANVDPLGLAVDNLHLFVADSSNNRVSKFDSTTGTLINADFITGLNLPTALALDGNNHLFVGCGGTNVTGAVREYDATTGAVLNADFIPGLPRATTLLVVSPVPEPSSGFLFVLGGLAARQLLRRRVRAFGIKSRSPF